MTKTSCSSPTPEQRQFLKIREAAERRMLDEVSKAIDAATGEVADEFRKAGLQFEPTSKDYFVFVVQQAMFVTLSGGDPGTLEGGNPDIGEKVVRNCRHIIDEYWRKGTEAAADISVDLREYGS